LIIMKIGFIHAPLSRLHELTGKKRIQPEGQILFD